MDKALKECNSRFYSTQTKTAQEIDIQLVIYHIIYKGLDKHHSLASLRKLVLSLLQHFVTRRLSIIPLLNLLQELVFLTKKHAPNEYYTCLSLIKLLKEAPHSQHSWDRCLSSHPETLPFLGFRLFWSSCSWHWSRWHRKALFGSAGRRRFLWYQPFQRCTWAP